MVNIEKRIDENNAHYELVVTGEIDASSSIHLDEALREAMENSKNILVDLSGLDYISSAGLGVFMSNIQKIEQDNISFVLFGMKDKVFEVFEILGLDQLLVIKKEKEEALEALK
ncbi:STAS domain-containing protein [Reichenbachiella agarivorans]|uniref:Anti-sigma factor antagonist n=1 Tax=Reichenbachiella agarivorans TaxID=2979464 RepID=A0ABY6CSD0_9BACT|nr:STAS domain-containing protein [Reichenbachiella agarivorans]UXP33244.1 STAS domain-containing protein [Reichenbachiella agarivorans]